MYDFFVKAVSLRYGFRLPVCKTAVDLSLLLIAVVMTFCFFGKAEGIGWGTLLMAVVNGTIIGFFSRLLDRAFVFRPRFARFSALFALEGERDG